MVGRIGSDWERMDQVAKGKQQVTEELRTRPKRTSAATVEGKVSVPIRCDPPRRMRPPPSRQESWADRLEHCQDGAWWLVRTYSLQRSAVAIASHLRAGVKPTPPGKWSFISGRTEDGRYGIWARRTDVVSGSGRLQR